MIRRLLAVLAVLSGAAGVTAEDARALNAKAWEAFQAGSWPACESLAREAWSAAEAGGQAAQAGVAAANVAAALAARGRFADALAWSARAEERLARADAATQARATASRAVIHYLNGEREEGARAFGRALAAVGGHDWRLEFLQALVKMYADLDLGPSYDALKALAGSAATDEQRALCEVALGWAASLFGGPALEHFTEARRLAGDGGTVELRVFAARDQGVALMRRDLEGAEAALRSALQIARAADDRRLRAIVLNDLSLLHVQQGREAPAREADQQAEALVEAIADDLRQGRREDTMLLDFRQLAKLRYLNRAPPLFPLSGDLFAQLAVDPRPAQTP
jgi:hypothetical protein